MSVLAFSQQLADRKKLNSSKVNLLPKPVEGMPILQSANDICQNCNAERYLKPNMSILVSTCFHKLCDDCIVLLFDQRQAPCPVCKTNLKKMDFCFQTFEDLTVEKEVRIRKRYVKIFNLRRDDFETTRQYDDYLEFVENFIFDEYNGVNSEENKNKVAKFRKDYEKAIIHNNNRKLREDGSSRIKLEAEKRRKKELNHALIQKLETEKQHKLQLKKELIDSLADTTKEASDINSLLDAHKAKLNEPKVQLQAQFQMVDQHTYKSVIPTSHLQIRNLQKERDRKDNNVYLNTNELYKPLQLDELTKPSNFGALVSKQPNYFQLDKFKAGGYHLSSVLNKARFQLGLTKLVPLPQECTFEKVEFVESIKKEN